MCVGVETAKAVEHIFQWLKAVSSPRSRQVEKQVHIHKQAVGKL